MNVKIKLLSPDAKIPTKAHDSDACFDIYACEPNAVFHEWGCGYSTHEVNGLKIRPGETVMVHTGFATEIPVGYYMAIYARSGLSTKQGLRLANNVGIVDCQFRNEVMVAIYNDSNETRIIHHGDRIAQCMIAPVLDTTFIETETLDNNDRGGGFGSSGIK